MRSCRIHVMGASGSGTTALGRALAEALALPHHDTDDYYWQPTTPPYRVKRELSERLRLMQDVFLPRSEWVLSGALESWGGPIADLFDLVVFVLVPTDVRLKRLREREARHFGSDAVAPGGWRHQETEEFMDWASHYDDGRREVRCRASHETWLATLTCPVLRVDGTLPIPGLVRQVAAAVIPLRA